MANPNSLATALTVFQPAPKDYGICFAKLAEQSRRILEGKSPDSATQTHRSAAPQTFEEFARLAPERQLQILNDMKLFCDLLGEARLPARRATREFEISFFLRFLARAGLQPPGDGFLERIDDGDIIEVYDIHCTQIYRSRNIFQVCSYSLPELLVYPFGTLYERPSWILERLMELVPQALSAELKLIDFRAAGVDTYVLRERFEGHNRVNIFEMKYCRGLLGAQSGAPEAFVSTGAVTPLADGERPGSLGFI